MSFSNNVVTVSLPAGSDLTAHQFKFVVLNTDGEVVLPGSAAVRSIGVLLNTPDEGEIATVAIAGVVPVIAVASTGVTAAGLLATNTAGTAVITSTNGDIVQGTALRAGAAGTQVPVLLGAGSQSHFGA